MSDEAERLYELRDEFDAEAQRYAAAEAAASAVSGSDESGTIEVELHGTKPTVKVREGWRRHHEPSGLGDAIMAVITAVGMKRLEQAQTAADESTAKARPIPTFGETPAALTQAALERHDDPFETTAALNRMLAMMDTIAEGIDETFRTIAGRGSTVREAESVPGHVTAQVRGAGLARLELDEDWLQYAGASEITRELSEAISAAVKRAEEETPANPLDGTPLEGLRSMLEDPAAVGRYLSGEEDFATRPEGR